MRHRKRGRKFGRVKKVRKALLRSLSYSLIKKEKITTTEAKARELRPFIEKLITISKKNTLASRRLLSGRLDAKSAKKISTELSGRYSSRSGGYTRIIKLPRRGSDNAKMAVIELVK